MLWETFRLAIQAIFRNAMRSFLTVLGIVIGVAAVIAMVTVGQGSTRQVTADVEKLGTNVVMVLPGQDSMQGGPGGMSVPWRALNGRASGFDLDCKRDRVALIGSDPKTLGANKKCPFQTRGATKKTSNCVPHKLCLVIT